MLYWLEVLHTHTIRVQEFLFGQTFLILDVIELRMSKKKIKVQLGMKIRCELYNFSFNFKIKQEVFFLFNKAKVSSPNSCRKKNEQIFYSESFFDFLSKRYENSDWIFKKLAENEIFSYRISPTLYFRNNATTIFT